MSSLKTMGLILGQFPKQNRLPENFQGRPSLRRQQLAEARKLSASGPSSCIVPASCLPPTPTWGFS